MASRDPVAGEEGLRSFFWPIHLGMHLALWIVIVAFLSIVAAIGVAFFLHGADGPAAYMHRLVNYYMEQAPNRLLAETVSTRMETIVFGLPGMASAAARFSAQGVVQAGGYVLDRAEIVLVTMYALQLLGIRLVLLLFAAPALVMLLAIALIDGFVARYVRRESGGHESATRHTRAKRLLRKGIIPSVALVWLVAPLQMSLASFFLPVAAIMSTLIWVMAKYFKKYL